MNKMNLVGYMPWFIWTAAPQLLLSLSQCCHLRVCIQSLPLCSSVTPVIKYARPALISLYFRRYLWPMLPSSAQVQIKCSLICVQNTSYIFLWCSLSPCILGVIDMSFFFFLKCDPHEGRKHNIFFLYNSQCWGLEYMRNNWHLKHWKVWIWTKCFKDWKVKDVVNSVLTYRVMASLEDDFSNES